MTIVINTCFGGFSLPDDFCKKYNMKRHDRINRTDERLVNYVREHGGVVEFHYSKLCAYEIPENATDYRISEYDGAESIIYVVDGKIHEM